MTKFSHKILEKIKKEKMSPKPRWYFVLMHTLLSVAIIGSVIIGSFAVAIIVRNLTSTDWELAHYITGNHLQTLVMITPYLWLAFVVISIFTADKLFRHTKKGYRFRPLTIGIASVLLSILIGNVMYAAKIDEPIENQIRQRVPGYQMMEARKRAMFSAPEKGVIAGEVKHIIPGKEMTLVDFTGREWKVDISKGMRPNGMEPPMPGMRVGIMGNKIDEQTFETMEMHQWKRNQRIKKAMHEKLMKEKIYLERIN